MACEFLHNEVQTVALNNPILFNTSISCKKGYIYHEPGTGNFILKGAVNNPCNEFAQYQVTFNGNIAIPTGGTTGPIAVSIALNGEPRLTSKAVYTAVAGAFGNVTSTAIIKVPKGCCFSLSIDSVAAVDGSATANPAIEVANANLTITRIA